MDSSKSTYVTELLETCPDRMRKIALLHYELSHISNVLENEMIEAMALSHGDGAGRLSSPSNHISDKTLYIALNYQSRTEKMNAEVKEEIVTQLVKLEREQKRLEYYMSLLEERQAKVLRLTYFDRFHQDEVAKNMGLSVRTVQTLKSRALTTLTEMYQFVKELH